MTESDGPFITNIAAEAVPSAAELEHHGARFLNASTDDTLGLGADTRVREAVATAIRKFSLTLPPDAAPIHALEEQLAAWLGAEQARWVPSLDTVLPRLHRLGGLWVDERVTDAWTLGGHRFANADALEASALEQPFVVVTDAVRPLEGDLSPVPRLTALAERRRGLTVIIQELGAGVLGERGAGAVDHFGATTSPVLTLTKLSGALVGSGWIVSGDRAAIGALTIPKASHATASVAATTRTVELLRAEPQRRARLFELTQKLLEGLGSLGLDTGPCVTPWVPVWVGDEALCVGWLKHLEAAGVAVKAYVAPQRSRLLLSPAATFTNTQLEQLIAAIGACATKVGKPVLDDVPTTPVIVARPGSFAIARPCAPRWVETQRAPVEDASDSAQPVREQIFQAVETLTWRLANGRIPTLRALLEPQLRAAIDRARKRER